MRFIYEPNYINWWHEEDVFNHTTAKRILNNSSFFCTCLTMEDTQDNIIWLINSQESYKEMRGYYVKG